MNLPADWPTNVNDATRVQENLRSQVKLVDDWPQPPRFVAGVDVGFEDEGQTTRAAVVVLSFPSLVPADRALARLPTSFPYVPGYLSFREIPAVLAALEQLALPPDLLLVDGHGIAHPRRLGIAAHLGVLTGLPALGVGKSLLVGRHDSVPQERGAWTPLVHRGETVGAALCTRPGTKPVFISPGHRISLATALHYVMACTTKYRLPETTRHAHHLASNLK